MPNQPDHLPQSMDDGGAADRRLSARSPTASLLAQLDERKTDWILVVNGSYSTWKLVTSEVLQKSILRPVLFNIRISSLEEETRVHSHPVCGQDQIKADSQRTPGQGCHSEGPR